MRLSARLLVAGLAVVAAGSMVGCSTSPGVAVANGATKPSSRNATASAHVSVAPAADTAQAATPPILPAPTGATSGAPSQAVTPSSASPAPSAAPAGPRIAVVGGPRGVKAQAGILADATTGQVLWDKSGDAARPIASITKVMTAYLVIQAGDLGRKITIPKAVLNYVAKYGANSAGLVPGNVLTVDQLLHALLLVSAGDAAYTLATAYGPGLPAFVAKMNATALKLGLTHTHFTSPDGLPYPTETSTYSTPAELLKLGEVAMRSAEFRSIVDERFYQMKKGPGHRSYWWDNSNDLIGYYRGAIGIKTGYTDKAGHCLLFEAVRGDRNLIGVVLGSPPTGPAAGAQDAARVLNWGFALKDTE
jgi:D-alanyl-D-alanine carboxypeptidase (penicillin-binding protein 5/6)